MNKLRGMTCYIIGAMDHAPDGGVEWRVMITPFLENMGVIVLNPCRKQEIMSHAIESDGNRKLREVWKTASNYDKLAEEMRQIRVTDLRMVDKADFIICYLDLDILTCGTWEELFWANRLKRPLLVIVQQGKKKCPDWLFGTIPHEHIFSDWDALKNYVKEVNTNVNSKTYNRWVFFNMIDKMKTSINGV